MKKIGYGGGLLVSRYEYADCREDVNPTNNIDIACFAQFPHDYRNACIGVTQSNGLSGKSNVECHGALGAPMIFEVDPSGIGRWMIEYKSGIQSARLLENIPFKQIESVFQKNATEWSPKSIQRAKGISLREEPRQLDFVDLGNMDFLEGIFHKKMHELLKDTIPKVLKALTKGKKATDSDYKYVFKIVFRFLAAKIFRDRKHDLKWNSDNALEILISIEEHYSEPKLSDKLNPDVMDLTWKIMLDSFHFQNISVDDLAYIYENSFIEDETRKKWGIHSTPSKVAEYLVRKLPFEDLPRSGRRVLEPCSGHGIFLVAAMRRLRELLPQSWGPEKKHAYLKDRLIGIEVGHFASEVGRLSLTLADYPNPDGWQLHVEDIFETSRLSREAKKADIVLCNPPFEKFKIAERKRYPNLSATFKPAEILHRVLSSPPALLGFVLPQVFMDGGSYSSFHKTLAKSYGNIEMVSLPDSLFTNADVDSMLLMGWNQGSQSGRVTVQCRDVRESEKEDFCRKDKEPLAREKSFDRTALEFTSLWAPRLSKVWDYLSGYPTLGKFANIHQGVNWISARKLLEQGRKVEERYSDCPLNGFSQGYVQQTGNLCQFSFKDRSIRYLSLNPELHYNRSYKFPWLEHKVVCNAARFERKNPWRIATAFDKEGLVFTKRCFALWETSELRLLTILALLNSPLANAFVYAHDKKVDNHIRTLKRLPIPTLSALEREQVEKKTKDLLDILGKAKGNYPEAIEEKAQRALLELDAAVLKAYDLPPVLERELLDTFEGFDRHTPFAFPKSYYPEGFEAFFPLHEVISKDFEDAIAEKVLKRIKPFTDKRSSEIISSLMEDHS